MQNLLKHRRNASFELYVYPLPIAVLLACNNAWISHCTMGIWAANIDLINLEDKTEVKVD